MYDNNTHLPLTNDRRWCVYTRTFQLHHLQSRRKWVKDSHSGVKLHNHSRCYFGTKPDREYIQSIV